MKKTSWLCGTAAVLSLLLPFWLLATPSGGILSFDSPIPKAGRVLLVTAHPDDETIFFSPTISALRHAGNEVFLLCFTNGNYHGLGQVRQQELLTAAAALQVEADHVKVIDHENIQDGHHTDWDEQEMLRILTAETRANAIDTIVTFDEGGVYGHKNHKACFDAVREFLYSCESLPVPSLPLDPAAVPPQDTKRPRRLVANPQDSQALPGAQLLAQPDASLSAAGSIMADVRLPRGSRFTTLGKRGHSAARTAGVRYPSSGAESGAEAGDQGSSPLAGTGRKAGRQLDKHRGAGAYRGRKLRAGRLAARAQAAARHKMSADEPRSGRKLAATGRLQAASSSSHAGLRLEAGRGCPKAYQLLTVSKLRKYASMLDVLPSALEGKLHLVTYVNRSIAATFTAMSAHNSQWRWWVHVLTTRYTFVNTLQLLGPDPRLDRRTALKLAQQEAGHAAAAGSAPADAAELDKQTIASVITGGNR